MKIIISGRNIQLTAALKDHINDKVKRLEQHFDFVTDIHFFLTAEKNPSIHLGMRAEATVHINGAVLKIHVNTADMYGSIDKLIDKINRSLTKHKTKLLHRHKAGHTHDSIRHVAAAAEAAVADGDDDDSVTGTEEDSEALFFTFVEEDEAILEALEA
jgi:putative sigma-54 modulation protein